MEPEGGCGGLVSGKALFGEGDIEAVWTAEVKKYVCVCAGAEVVVAVCLSKFSSFSTRSSKFACDKFQALFRELLQIAETRLKIAADLEMEIRKRLSDGQKQSRASALFAYLMCIENRPGSKK